MLMIAFAALAPLVVSALMALRVHQRALEDALGRLEASTAEAGALHTRDWLAHASQGMKLLAGSTVRWRELAPDERTGALWLVYRQHADVAAAALVQDGHALGPAVFREAGGASTDGLDAHPLGSAALAAALVAHAPAATRAGEAQLGAPLATSAGAVVPIAVLVDGAQPAWTVVAAVSLASLCAELARVPTGATRLELLDARGAGACAGASPDPRLTQAALAGERALAYTDAFGEHREAALARAGAFTVVAHQPTAIARAASIVIRRQTIFWITLSLAIALAAGAFLARGITRPVGELARGAAQVARGDFSWRAREATATDGDELGRLARAFQHMCVEVEKRDAEIRRFNDELQARVDARTRELVETQALLNASQKIAAVSSLGAGMAHEINNPLTGVLGFTQVLIAQAKNAGDTARAEVLALIEKDAQRIRDVVQVLLSFSQNYAGEHLAELDVNAVVAEALARAGLAGGIEIARELAADVPRVLGSAAQLDEALGQLFKNAATAMRGQGRLTITTSATDGVVKIAVADTGKGIAPEHLPKIFDPFFTTKDDPRGEGLGLTVAHRIVEEHHGTLKAASTPGQGATFIIALPAATRGAHLA
jgi:two-component system, NtrC family, sensor kinase